MLAAMRQIAGLLLALCCLKVADVQGTRSAGQPLLGCYQVVSLDWSPPDETIRLMPNKFQLLGKEAEFHGHAIFGVRSLPIKPNIMDRSWAWEPRGDQFWISFSTGFGGFRGTLRPSSANEFVGKLKEWCDFRCETKRVGKIRVRRVACAE